MSAIQQEAPEGFEVFDTFDYVNAFHMIRSLADRLIEECGGEHVDFAYSVRSIAELYADKLSVTSPAHSDPMTIKLYTRKIEGREE